MCGGICNCTFIVLVILTNTLILFIPLVLFYTLDEPDSGRENKLTNTTITQALDETDYYPLFDLVMSVSLILLAFIGMGRAIQLSVLFQRSGNYSCCIRFLNISSVIIIVLAAINFVITIMVTQSMNESLHAITAILAIFLGILYSLANIILTLIQRCTSNGYHQYDNCFSKYFELFFLIPLFIVTLVSNLVFAVDSVGENILGTRNNSRTIFEWVGYWALFAMFIISCVTFYRGPVDDELKQFFCSCNKNKNSNDKERIEMYMSSTV